MRYYALIIMCNLWTIVRFVKTITSDCWELDIPFIQDIESAWIFYPLAIFYVAVKSAIIPAIISCFLYILLF